jgi:broad specificity phosphatase PhoE
VTAHEIVLIRHGETSWSKSGRHTGRTDIPLTGAGEAEARKVGVRLTGRRFALVLASPLGRAMQTCRLAGFTDPEIDGDLVEWDYGELEGRTTAEIRETSPGWSVWSDSVPGGESAADVAVRADRVLARIDRAGGDVLVFSHGHQLRVLAARWLGLDATAGRLLALGAGSLSVLGWEREQPVIVRWNET